MKLNLVFSLITLILFSCEKQLQNEKIFMENFNGKSEFIYFKNANLGYSFNNIHDSESMAENQINDVNYFPKSNNFGIILKTENGGKSWKCIDTIQNFTFYDNFFSNHEYILIQIKNTEENLQNRILKFTIPNEKIEIFNYNFQRMGNIWEEDNQIFVNAKNNQNSFIFSIKNNFSQIDSAKNENVLKNSIFKLNTDFYSLTWDKQIYNLTKNEKLKLPFETEIAAPLEKNNILLIANEANSIKLYNLNLLSKKHQKIKEFNNYSIIKDLKKYENNFVGFIGNIDGVFTGYDLIYSLDNGKNWNIQKLNERNFVEPFWINSNDVFIYQGLDKLTKIKLKN